MSTSSQQELAQSVIDLPAKLKNLPPELKRSETWSLLIEDVDPTNAPRLLCKWHGEGIRPMGSVNTFHTLEKLWSLKRAELIPEEPRLLFANKKNASGKRYLTKPVLLLKRWLTMPRGHYGTAAEPRLDVTAAAKYTGLTETTIVTYLKDKAIPDWSREGRGEIRTYSIADLDDFKAAYADGISTFHLRDVADEIGWTMQKLRLALTRIRENKNGRTRPGIVISHEPTRLRNRKSGPPADSMTKTERDEIKRMFERKKRPGFLTGHEMADKVAGNGIQNRVEVYSHAKLWHELGLLPGESVIIEKTRTPKNKTRPETYTLEQMSYDEKRFLSLWNGRCSPRVGATHLVNLLLPYGTKRPYEEIADEMRSRGFVGRRLLEAMHFARVKTLPVARGLGRHGRRSCELIDSKKKTKLIDVQKAISDLFSGGVLLVSGYEKALEEEGLSRVMGAIKRAEDTLGFQSKRIGFHNGPWVCKINSQEWPTETEARLLIDKHVIPVTNAGEPARGENRADRGPGHWITLLLAAEVSGINKGVIWRAAQNGEIVHNGKKRGNFRLDRQSFADWQFERAKKPERQESQAAVELKARTHVTEYKD